MSRLYSKPVIIVTGGAGGLGRELVASLSSNFQVVIFDINPDLSSVAKKFDCLGFHCDIVSPKQVQIAVDGVIKKLGRVDILINAAGLYLDGDLSQNDPEKIKKVFEVNSLGPIFLCRELIPHFKKQKSGQIININSLAGLRPKALCSVYHASKYALNGFSESLALELEPFGIKVNQIFPDIINTSFSKKGHIKRDFSRSLDPSAVVSLVNFLLNLPPHTTIPDVSIRYL
ncbi:MAG: SDR family oxidoreductase [Candidatus Shapirobacteria bacterium]|jgi:NAD(P)-dependent dehydrogenase (short-subunit alcohol dehydrogenase family)